MTRRRIAIVTPWYGPEATGGAESLARDLAVHLSASADVTILTTTARSFLADWGRNDFKAGRSREAGYEVLRFRLGPRNNAEFHRVNGELMQMSRDTWGELVLQRARTNPFVEDSINSPGLEDFLRGKEAARFDAVAFIPYLYGVVIRGIEAFPGRAHLIPCLHDEVYAALPRIEDAVHKAATLLFNSDGEAELALRLFGPGILHKSHVIGTGITPPVPPGDGTPVDGPYFLFLGRRDAHKGIAFLIDAFARYREADGAAGHRLVLAGPGEESYDDPERGIRDLGFVDEATKQALLRDAAALLQPSLNESYSRVMMEAWRAEIPVVAQAGCLATATAVRRSGGGLTASGQQEWRDALLRLAEARAEERRELGRRGAAYAAANADWAQVVARFRAATGLDAPPSAPKTGKRVDQVVETMAYGDAISDYARFLRDRVRARGSDSDIYARMVLPQVAGEAKPLNATALASSDGVIYHHSIAFDNLGMVLAAPGKQGLIYHNITPASFFRPYDETFADHLERGRGQIAELKGKFAAYGADSTYNADELREQGFGDVTTIPFPTNLARFDVTPAPVSQMSDGMHWLHVGRISPSKGLRPLIEAFEVFACLDPHARLVLVGAFNPAERYYQELMKLVIERNLEANVVFTGTVDEATLTAHYRNSDVYVTLSEHEGFCAPLVEAMFFDLPVVARASAAIPETLGDAGILLGEEAGPIEVAVLVDRIRSDAALRDVVLESQRRRRAAFLPERIVPILDRFVAELV